MLNFGGVISKSLVRLAIGRVSSSCLFWIVMLMLKETTQTRPNFQGRVPLDLFTTCNQFFRGNREPAAICF